MSNKDLITLSSEAMGDLCLCSVRYALGRRTYIVCVVADLVASVARRLPRQCVEVMLRDINECQYYGDACDKESWMNLKSKLMVLLEDEDGNTI